MPSNMNILQAAFFTLLSLQIFQSMVHYSTQLHKD